MNPASVETSLAQHINRVLNSGQIARSDQKLFLGALASDRSLSSEENAGIRQVFERLQMGLLRVVE